MCKENAHASFEWKLWLRVNGKWTATWVALFYSTTKHHSPSHTHIHTSTFLCLINEEADLFKHYDACIKVSCSKTLDMQSGGSEEWTPDFLISGWPALNAESQIHGHTWLSGTGNCSQWLSELDVFFFFFFFYCLYFWSSFKLSYQTNIMTYCKEVCADGWQLDDYSCW